MAVLSADDRQAVAVDLCRDLSSKRTPFNLSDADLTAAVNAVDDWVDANSASFNTTIPQPARSTLTPQQKAQILMLVVQHRFTVS